MCMYKYNTVAMTQYKQYSFAPQHKAPCNVECDFGTRRIVAHLEA